MVATTTATPVSAVTTYDDQDAAFVYSAGWTQVTHLQAHIIGQFKLTQSVGLNPVPSTSAVKNLALSTRPVRCSARWMSMWDEASSDAESISYADCRVPAKMELWRHPGAGTHQLKLVFVRPSTARVSVDAATIPYFTNLEKSDVRTDSTSLFCLCWVNQLPARRSEIAHQLQAGRSILHQLDLVAVRVGDPCLAGIVHPR